MGFKRRIAPPVDANHIQSVPVDDTPPANNELLKYNSTTGQYEPKPDVAGSDEKVKASGTDPSAGFLDAKVDGSSIEISSEKLQVKAGVFEAADPAIMKEGENISLLSNNSDFQSGAQVDGKITTHKNLPNAHHTPPTALPSTVIQDSDATEFTTTNTSFTQAKRFSKTTLAKKYRIDMFCEIYQSDKDKMVIVQGQIDDTIHVFQDWETPDQNEARDIPMAANGVIFATLTAASHNFDFDIKQQRGGTAKARNFRLIITEVVE